MRTCPCGNKIPSKFKIDGKWRNLSRRVHCLTCIPHGGSGFAPNAVKPTYRESNNRAVTHYRQQMKLKAIEYLGNACWECLYDKCKGALIFHHIDPSTKEFGISDGRTRRWETLVKELDKCALLCNRCHEEVHAGMLDIDQVVNRHLLQGRDSNPRQRG